MTVGSLFSGVEGFGRGFEQAGFDVAWQVEREPFCIAVLKTHFPNVERYYDILRCGHERIHKLKPVDVITAGFPCQDLSVAGKRAGLAGTRSGLFWEAIRIAGELRPSWFVLENVPGLLSSNGGEDFEIVMTELNRIGYVIDPDIMDSQFFGVAQRRRRVFLVCAQLEGLLSAKINSSGQILTSLAAETLLNGWVALQPALYQGLSPLASEVQTAELSDSAKARIVSFGTMLERCDQWTSPAISGGDLESYMGVLAALALNSQGLPMCAAPMSTPVDTRDVLGLAGITTANWPRLILGASYSLARLFTTSTSSDLTTEPLIAPFSLLTLLTAKLMLRYGQLCPNSSTAALSLLTALRVSIVHARSAVSSLFTDQQSRKFWWAYIDQAEACAGEFERSARTTCPAEVLFESEGGEGDFAESGQAWEGIAAETCDRIASPIRHNDGGSDGGGPRGGYGENLVAHANASVGHGIVPNLTCLHEAPIINIQDVRGHRDKKQNGIGISSGEPCYTLDGTSQHAVAGFCIGAGATAGTIGYEEEMSPTLRGANGGNRAGVLSPTIDSNGVRDFAGLPEGMDSARYRALGNAVTASVAKWIAERIKAVMEA